MKKGNIIIKNASEIVTSSGFKAKSGKQMSDPKLIKNGALVIEDGIILAVGKSDEIAARFSEDGCQVIDASGRAVLPGFIDPHTHFLFGGYRADEFHWRLRGDSYMDIMKRGGGILSTVRATRESSREELVRNGLKRLDTMLSQGVTTVEGKSGYGLDRDTEIKTLEVMKELDALHPIDVRSARGSRQEARRVLRCLLRGGGVQHRTVSKAPSESQRDGPEAQAPCR
jgi:imidazolonepropionase